jgi:PAS domain S-box-containing protein
MAQLFLFAALVQAALITIFLGRKASKQDLPALLLFLLMVNYSLVLFVGFWNSNNVYQLSRLHVPIGYASGPIYYFFVRFSFLPIKNVKPRWLLWFLPVVFEIGLALVYWLLFAVNSTFADSLKGVLTDYNRLSFLYFVLFFVATIVFLIQNNALITMNIVYKKQLTWLKYFIVFIILFILDETLTADGQILSSSILACSFTTSFVYFLFHTSLSVQNNQAKEVLKEALNEREKAVVITNENEIVEYVNEPFLTIIGYRHRDVIGRKLSFLRGQLTSKQSIDYMDQKLREKVEFEVDIINYRKSGEAYVCHIVMIPVFSDNKLTHFVAYEEDVETISEATPSTEELVLLVKIKTYFETDEPYKNKQLQVADVAEATYISARRIGEILKKCEDKSFSEFVNTYRIQAVIKLLQMPDNQHLTIEALSQMCGFNSKSVFHTAFKKETGKTPKGYLGQEIES